MGNNSSSSHQYCASNGPSQEIGRGWTQSFPRELARHHPQQPGHKVLPEPPNQRLRATNNGSIIHNGGTISGRRPPALTLPHDLNKGIFRSRSTSASNIGASRGRRLEQHRCCHHRNESCCMENEMQELKRFGSEPDLRYSPMEREARCNGKQHAMEHRHCGSGHYPERDSRERESRYKGKKKYKAPAPPSSSLVDGSSPDSYSQDRPGGCRGEEEVQPQPPRRSRLFKTRAETKRAQVNWLSSSALSSQASAERCENVHGAERDRRWRGGEDGRNGAGNKENRLAWRSHQVGQQQQQQQQQHERWCREEQRRSRILDGKNTLQRSMSSPEFQAELMQVARKVRNKLNCGGRSSVDSAKVSSLERAGDVDRCAKEAKVEESKRPEKRSARNEEGSGEEQRVMIEDRMIVDERRLIERCVRPETKLGAYDERTGNARISKDYLEERQADAGSGGKRRLLEKSTTFDDKEDDDDDDDGSSALPHQEAPRAEAARKGAKDRPDAVGHPAGAGGERSFPSEKERRELMEDYQRAKSVAKTRKYEQTTDTGRSRSESPAIKTCGRERVSSSDPRGQGSGRESTPERTEAKEREKENSDRRWRKSDARNTDGAADERRWAEPVPATEKRDASSKEKLARKAEAKEAREKNWHVLQSPEKSAPKTFYFGMDDALTNEPRNCVDQQMEQLQARLHAREVNGSAECMLDYTDDGKSGIEDISLKLRPTLPKKQLEIPRFSPSAAWRLLSALEAPGPTMSTASEEIPVMFEERIERLSRPPPPLIALGPRSSHDKSGDSGISGDAGAANDDSLDVSTTNRLKTPATRPTWTPQQDLGEESSSDAGVDSPPPMPTPVKFPPRAHVFSLSLPRDDNRMYLYNPDVKGKEGSTFNSLQKLKRSVSGALGLGPLDLERKRTRDVLDDNWLLSTSAPTSLQHTQITDGTRSSPPGWKPSFDDEDEDVDELDEVDLEDRGDFPVIMKPPSFSYLASGGHVMYLPESNDSQYQSQSLNCRTNMMADNEKNSGNNCGPKYRKNGVEELSKPVKDAERTNKYSKDSSVLKDKSFASDGKMSNKFSKSCENISSEMKQRSSSPPSGGQQNLQDDKEISPEVKLPLKINSKGRRFTFQSTVRQIERRRLAEKLSREAEAKERQRKGELEAMRKVEEEFQRKRAREKANIRQQLRLYSMDENLSSLPTVWDSSQLSRADPDGAPSSSASSPTSVPPAKLTTIRKSSVSSDEYLRKRAPSADSRQHHQHHHHHQQQQQQQQHQPQQREYKDYRPKYYDWAPESSSHLEYKQTTVHPKVVCDIPKSSPVFVDANAGKAANLSSTPRSDNYRKDFAHGAVAARSSLASSDSELSQPNTRPHSRQAGGKSKPLRSRSASPERSEEAASSEDESPVEPVKQERSPMNGFVLNAVQPFVREKSYRPISFNPQPPPPIPS
ncbi:uncharacterized protein LOC105190640 isoform X1 [Harpegnathos saltator]|uniref:uncharacterized protein LOC105190640 isoform X1 n=1 Tax=Harpegnathos saltator TaxID=610380 RepID=UPI000DBEEDA8|nr:uncharacterized protein LOC105190640 isoform X1 [Harpegnathos saltator]XP_025161250.1 uncharacterized protein LOC105190640 isoform X1 [Harpegnathos saltator]XP_025161251.1 uncharacterized protein LOC105190640 isoform X1 [Harpegnathos saltator]